MFTTNTYIARRQKLRQELHSGMLLFLGNDECGINYEDNTYPFRQDSTFLYFFGIERPGLAAIIDIEEGTETIFGDEQNIDDVVWTGTLPTLRAVCESVGITRLEPTAKLGGIIDSARVRGRIIHFLPTYRAEHRLKLFDLMNILPPEQARRVSRPFISAIIKQRIYKSDDEVREIEKAVDISIDMHLEAARLLRPGIKESEIAAAVTAVAERDGGSLAFPVIATVNGQVLHNHTRDAIARDGQLFLLDAGAETRERYVGDISSTFPVGRRFTEPQRVIYEIVLAAHRAAVDALRPGVHFKEVHLAAAAAIFEGLKAIGLTRGGVTKAVQAGAHALFFPCGTGHLMGLDVHDMEGLGERWVGYNGIVRSEQFGLKSLRLSRPLEPGFVLTIEPGIYFIPELVEQWRANKHLEQFINYDKIEPFMHVGGIRNEEDYLITDNGKRRLGKPLPLDIDDVENLRGA
ncbi:MAG: aminopeptidase P family protein [Odoribacteraceae bacterium]|jgi:Xaa-Pro aminopeptidase|nr:aminopeptidase P family protein [Odoribacteraceae bacterium]